MNKSVNPDAWINLNQEIIECRLCPRLVEWRETVALSKKRAYKNHSYWGKPVCGFGDINARVLVVGLAPGAHGSNRTGRMFTGDSSGDFLYAALHRTGFANQPVSREPKDGLSLTDIFITAVGRCAPPANKPTPVELQNCAPFLQREIDLLPTIQGLVALGRIAFDRLLRLYLDPQENLSLYPFSHGAYFSLGPQKPWLLVSYHPSRQNTQTGRLTPIMFDSIWQKVRSLLPPSG